MLVKHVVRDHFSKCDDDVVHKLLKKNCLFALSLKQILIWDNELSFQQPEKEHIIHHVQLGWFYKKQILFFFLKKEEKFFC